jgi:hypothetical protein
LIHFLNLGDLDRQIKTVPVMLKNKSFGFTWNISRSAVSIFFVLTLDLEWLKIDFLLEKVK